MNNAHVICDSMYSKYHCYHTACYLAKNYDLFQDTTLKSWHHVHITGKPIIIYIMPGYLMEAYNYTYRLVYCLTFYRLFYLLMQMTPASIACVQELVSCCAGHVNILGSNP